MQLTGIHHLTAISADAPGNERFYTGTMLGMRLVKKTVNQDDVTAYHLFYADGAGAARHRSHLLRLAGAAASSAARTRSPAPACASPAPETCTWWKERLTAGRRAAPARSPSDRRPRRRSTSRTRRASGSR